MTVNAAAYVDWASMWKILVISIIVGVGLVAVFAVGLVALSSSGYIHNAEGNGMVVRRNIPALVVAIVCAVIVILAVIYGIHEIFAKG